MSQPLEEKVAFMEFELHELRERLSTLEKELLNTQKVCSKLKVRLLDQKDSDEEINPWETGSRL